MTDTFPTWQTMTSAVPLADIAGFFRVPMCAYLTLWLSLYTRETSSTMAEPEFPGTIQYKEIVTPVLGYPL